VPIDGRYVLIEGGDQVIGGRHEDIEGGDEVIHV
jgi:hypothetical protein